MQKCLYAVILIALIFFACGEVSGEDSTDQNSSPSTNSSSSATDNPLSSDSFNVCQSQYCCNGAEFDNAINFCFEEQLYAKCGTANYNPYEKGCFGGKLYNNCSLESTRGVCVHNSLLRCRQEGKNENDDKIITVLPGMECQENGAITGTIRDYRGYPIPLNQYKEYKTVQIGKQVWMAENLNIDPTEYYTNYINYIDYLNGVYEADSIHGNSLCYDYYNKDNKENCDKYGRLYDWVTATGSNPDNCYSNSCSPSGNVLYSGMCPRGFFVPRSSDWEELVNYVGGSAIAGGRLKSTSGWTFNGNGTDNYGFNALPGGYAYYWGLESNELGTETYWWSITDGLSSADFWRVISSDTEVLNHSVSKDMYMFYVRCFHQ